MQEPVGSAAEYEVAIEIPPGYFELPLHNIDNHLDAALPFVENFSDGIPADAVADVMGTLKFLLNALVAGNTRYCGLGQHVSDTGERVASWLVISVMKYGKPQNPRLTLADIATAKKWEDPSLIVEPVDIEGRPTLFTESIRTEPQPEITDLATESGSTAVFQLEAFIPSEDGTTIAAIEFSTISVSEGPNFRDMFFLLATSAKLDKTPSRPSTLNM
ncbi:hypothetical protein [Nocardia violaceofusca]|uniref:hypothetical protein n=1 Tax=Nocardia violaceofusca TaxID=941182 RepID=UPI0007A4B3AE|nr:hypothetical protein [Nocardia violaceofusca]